MPTALDKILRTLETQRTGLCDDCLSQKAKVSPRQHVNQICRPLAAQGSILRIKSSCPSCSSFKLVNSIVDSSKAGLVKEPKSNEDSLTGLIGYYWVKDGCPSISWDELLERTVVADKELASKGDNPAKSFRSHRLAKNVEGMRTYIKGFYQYAFCPSFSSQPPAPPTNTVSLPNSPTQKNSEKVRSIFRKLEDILNDIKAKTNADRDNAGRISNLIRDNVIPRHIGTLMHSIRIKRNEVEHDRYEPEDSVMAAIQAEWAAICEWWNRQRKL